LMERANMANNIMECGPMIQWLVSHDEIKLECKMSILLERQNRESAEKFPK
jgi:hypothetical protein